MIVIYNSPRKRGFHDNTFLGVSLVMRQETIPEYGMIYRVPTQIAFSNSLCFPCVFPIWPHIFPVPIYVICDYYIHKTALSSSSKKIEIFAANIETSFTSRNREITTWAYHIPCVFPVFWQNFQIPCVFPDRDFFLTFSCFPCFLCGVGTLDIGRLVGGWGMGDGGSRGVWRVTKVWSV